MARHVSREGIDGGGPALELVQDLRQAAPESLGRSGDNTENGGSALQLRSVDVVKARLTAEGLRQSGKAN